jgi:hypothetical protein
MYGEHDVELINAQHRVSSLWISGFRHDFDEICAVLGYYAASCDDCFPSFRENVSAPSSRVLTREDGTDTLFRNVGKQLPHDAA